MAFTPPPPSTCQCIHLRIEHRGGKECRDCTCTKFRWLPIVPKEKSDA